MQALWLLALEPVPGRRVPNSYGFQTNAQHA